MKYTFKKSAPQVISLDQMATGEPFLFDEGARDDVYIKIDLYRGDWNDSELHKLFCMRLRNGLGVFMSPKTKVTPVRPTNIVFELEQ